MRKYDVAYVPSGPVNSFPAIPLKDLSLEEIRKKYIANCGKANGSISVCSKCKTPCEYGKRAVQLVANQVYNDPPVPLYGGKTLIENAREENMRRRAEMEKKKEEENKIKRKTYTKIENWYEDSLASGDQVKWLCEKMNISKTQAKKKIYQYKYMHGLTNKTENKDKSTAPTVNTTMKQFEEKIEKQKEIKVLTETKTDIEEKLEKLLKLQEQQKKAMEEYMKLYEQAKTEYDKLKQQADILCSAMDILNS